MRMNPYKIMPALVDTGTGVDKRLKKVYTLLYVLCITFSCLPGPDNVNPLSCKNSVCINMEVWSKVYL